METELKLAIKPEAIGKLNLLPWVTELAAEAPHTEKLTSTYFDTADLFLHRHNADLRVREINSRRIQTLKVADHVESGLHEREEWECPVNDFHPDLDMLRRHVKFPQWKKILQTSSLADRLQPVFATRVSRTIWLLRLKSGDEIELALDQGKIVAGDKSIPLSEVELELKAGNAASLYDFALQLLDDVDMYIDNRSKASRGYALCQETSQTPVKASPLEMSPKVTLEQGYCAILENCLEQVQANEPGVAEAEDSEFVHQMRVGLRRLRSAIKLFDETIAMPDHLQEELRWLASELGEARDWDVLSESTLVKVSDTLPDGATMESLLPAAQEQARQKRKQAAAAVKSVRYTRLMLALSGWLQSKRWSTGADEQTRKRLRSPLKKFSDKELAQDQKRLHKRGKKLPTADVESRHRVRIAAKRTRYATEFFQSLYPAKRVRPYVSALSQLQDELGWLNDAAVAEKLLREFQRPEVADTGLAGEAGFVRGYLASSTELARPKLQKMWKRFVPLRVPH